MSIAAKVVAQGVPLAYPVMFDGKTVDSLTMRRPTVKDMLAVESLGSEQQRELHLFASLCEVNPECLELLDLADYGQLQEVFSGFLRRPAAARTPQPSSAPLA